MAQTSYTPISLYYSATGGNTPLAANLVAGELAINTADGRLFYKDSSGVVQTIATKGGVNGTSNGQVLFNNSGAIGGSNNLFWDNSNGYLGIGTSSPAYRLDVAGEVRANNLFRTTDGTNIGLFGSGVFASNVIGVGSSNSVPLVFGTNATERMRIDSSGNLGLGVTPSAWNGYKTFQIAGNSATYSNGDGEIGFVQNAYYQSGWKYGATGIPASWHVQFQGQNQWHTAPSGTAGNAISFTQAMTLDASGNLAVGGYAAGNTVKVQNNVGGYATLGITSNADSLGYLDATNLFLFRVNATERMRIDSFGNLLVGTTATINATTNTFYKNVAEPTLHIVGNYNGNVSPLRIQRYASDGDGIVFFYGTTQKGYVSITSTGTTYNTLSDYRLKENITPMTGALDKVAQLKPVTYTWKENGADGQGFIAHELQDVVPECVSGEKDGIDEKGNPRYQGIDTSFLVATLTKAIQEQQTIINELKSRIETLENK